MKKENTCPDCGKKILKASRYCVRCAARRRYKGKKPNNCQGCGKAVPKTYRWCNSCQPTCVDCGASIGRQGIHCTSCGNRKSANAPRQRRRKSNAMKAMWADPVYRAKHKAAMDEARARPEYRQRVSETSKRKWADPEYRRKTIAGIRKASSDPDARRKKSEAAKQCWADPEYRQTTTESLKKAHSAPALVEAKRAKMLALWQDPEYRRRRKEAHDAALATPECQEAYRKGLANRHNPSGEEHYNWNGGCEAWYGEYPKEFDADFRLAIRERDGFRCVLCGKPEGKQAHICHHIDSNKNNNDHANLVLLCRPCHGKVHTGDFDAYRLAFEALFTNDTGAILCAQ